MICRTISVVLMRGACAAALLFQASACKDPTPTAGTATGSVEAAAAPARVLDGRLTEVHESGEVFDARLFAFELDRFGVAVRDVHMARALRPLLEDPKIEFATNGGFFGPDQAPVGLVVSNGVRLSAFDAAMSGGVLTIDDGRATLWQSETFDASAAHAWAIQCKPRLVVAGEVNIRSDDGQRGARTALGIERGGKSIVIAILARGESGPSLLASARYLASVAIVDALNLDGGPSTAAAWREADGPHAHEPLGPVRHAIVVERREAAP